MKTIIIIIVILISFSIGMMFNPLGEIHHQKYNKAITKLSNDGIIVIDSNTCFYYQDSKDTVLVLSNEQLQALWTLSVRYDVIIDKIMP